MNTTLTIKTDRRLRDQAKNMAKELGLPLTTVVNALLKQFVRDKEITLSLGTPNAETRRAMREVRGRKNLKTYTSFSKWEKDTRP
ncbi:type II toxin-antitoxin system RelB/DinJ family antitoxin [Patescibacteria group bacterium]|nr:type II toxin-antitoxin system RelB/DinJ family antitoxin [Patescibacteria group bacterium]